MNKQIAHTRNLTTLLVLYKQFSGFFNIPYQLIREGVGGEACSLTSLSKVAIISVFVASINFLFVCFLLFLLFFFLNCNHQKHNTLLTVFTILTSYFKTLDGALVRI